MNDAPLWPLGFYFLLVMLTAAVLIGLAHVLGEKRPKPAAAVPYESGIDPTGSARIRFDVKYYLIALFFVIFDLETVFIIAWAVSLRENGWSGFIEMAIFIGILMAALVYLWRLGGLETGTAAQTAWTPRRRD